VELDAAALNEAAHLAARDGLAKGRLKGVLNDTKHVAAFAKRKFGQFGGGEIALAEADVPVLAAVAGGGASGAMRLPNRRRTSCTVCCAEASPSYQRTHASQPTTNTAANTTQPINLTIPCPFGRCGLVKRHGAR
ncbi:MAG: hypothetical protein ACO310_05415, partial [Burkholderiaceae bacterium]